MPLKVAVDVRDLQKAQTGTKTYLEEVCREFRKINSSDIRFYYLNAVIPVYYGNNQWLRYIEHVRFQLWKQLVLPFKARIRGCNVLFCTDSFVPLFHLGLKTIPVMHDAFFFESPQDFGRLWLEIFYKLGVPAIKRSSFIVTPTQYAKKQINHFINLPDEKLVVVYEGPKQLMSAIKCDGDGLLAKFGLQNKRYLLHVGAMYRRKNIPRLIKAFALIKQQSTNTDLKLVLTGGAPINNTDNSYQEILGAIKVNHLEDSVVLTGYLNDADLSTIYQNALMYIFPSLNEGFGIPVLEAFKNELPVLTANNTCLPEVGGDAVISFDPLDTNDIASKIQLVLQNEELREEMIQKGRERLTLFSWKNTAESLIKIFKKAAGV